MGIWDKPANESNPAEVLIEFLTWGELLEYAQREPQVSAATSREYAIRDDWFGASWEGALKLAFEGWHEAEQKARAISEPLFDKISTLIQKDSIVYDVEGIGIDIGEYVKGEPECWQRIETHIVQGQGNRILRLVMNGFFSAGVKQDVIIARGATVAALVELLEYAGNRVEVVWHCPFNRGADFRAIVKAADQDLDMGRLMFAMAHPAMFRRIGFACLEQIPSQWISSYGSPTELHESVHKADIYLPCMGYGDRQWTSPEFAQKYILDKIKEQGVSIKED
jgi:hypothetical protein